MQIGQDRTGRHIVPTTEPMRLDCAKAVGMCAAVPGLWGCARLCQGCGDVRGCGLHPPLKPRSRASETLECGAYAPVGSTSVAGGGGVSAGAVASGALGSKLARVSV